ncbi:MAG: class B sortase [Oscillospiraceae bacterium]|jgi:sortase B|nr:class B sortase [Oscillospiraceae bacterium]
MKLVSTKKKYVINKEFFKKNARWFILGALICVFIFSATMLITTLIERSQARQEYEDIRQIAISGQNTTTPDVNTNTNTPEPNDDDDNNDDNNEQDQFIEAGITINHEALYELNPDYIGWIRIDGTDVDYPIVRCRNNERYIYTTFLLERNMAGAIFLDYLIRDRFDRFSVLYGHNREDGTMFTSLHEYRDEKFREENPDIMIFTPDDEILLYRVIAVRVTNVKDRVFTLRSGSQADINAYIERYDVADDTPILVLATCTDSWDSNERLVVIAARSEGIG